MLGQVAREAKPEDDFVLILIGHGSYDGVEYKFNLPGPDISGEDLARAVQPHSGQAPADRQHHERERRLDCRAAEGGARRDRRHQERHGEECHRVRALLGRGAARRLRRTWTRTKSISALEAFQYADRKTAEFYESQKRLATEHAVFEDTGKSEAVRAASDGKRRRVCWPRISLVLRLGAAQKAANDPAKRDLLAKERRARAEDRHAEVPESGDDRRRVREAASDALLELARVQGELDK